MDPGDIEWRWEDREHESFSINSSEAAVIDRIVLHVNTADLKSLHLSGYRSLYSRSGGSRGHRSHRAI